VSRIPVVILFPYVSGRGNGVASVTQDSDEAGASIDNRCTGVGRITGHDNARHRCGQVVVGVGHGISFVSFGYFVASREPNHDFI
jgi:hypothetical protein